MLQFSEKLLNNLMQIGLTVSLAALVPLVLRRLMKKRYPARMVCAVWAILALRLLVPVQLTLPQAPVQVMPRTSYVVQSSQTAFEQAGLPVAQTPIRWVTGTQAETLSAADTGTVKTVDITDILLTLWLVGVISCTLWQGMGHYRLMKSLKSKSKPVERADLHTVLQEQCAELAIDREIPLRVSSAADCPMLAGFVHPTLYLPDEHISRTDAAFIFRHELTHCKHGDLWLKLLLLAARCLHWFNPLVHLIARFAQEDIELACDDAVVRGHDGAYRRAYGETILRSAIAQSQKRKALVSCFGDDKKTLMRRFEGLFDKSVKKRGVALIVMIAILVGSLGCTIAVGDTDKGLTKELRMQLAQKQANETENLGYTVKLDGKDTYLITDGEFSDNASETIPGRVVQKLTFAKQDGEWAVSNSEIVPESGRVTSLDEFKLLYENDLGLPDFLSDSSQWKIANGYDISDPVNAAETLLRLSPATSQVEGSAEESAPYNDIRKVTFTFADNSKVVVTMINQFGQGWLPQDWTDGNGVRSRTAADLAQQYARAVLHKSAQYLFPILTPDGQKDLITQQKAMTGGDQWTWKYGPSSPSAEEYVLVPTDDANSYRVVFRLSGGGVNDVRSAYTVETIHENQNSSVIGSIRELSTDGMTRRELFDLYYRTGLPLPDLERDFDSLDAETRKGYTDPAQAAMYDFGMSLRGDSHLVLLQDTNTLWQGDSVDGKQLAQVKLIFGDNLAPAYVTMEQTDAGYWRPIGINEDITAESGNEKVYVGVNALDAILHNEAPNLNIGDTITFTFADEPVGGVQITNRLVNWDDGSDQFGIVDEQTTLQKSGSGWVYTVPSSLGKMLSSTISYPFYHAVTLEYTDAGHIQHTATAVYTSDSIADDANSDFGGKDGKTVYHNEQMAYWLTVPDSFMENGYAKQNEADSSVEFGMKGTGDGAIMTLNVDATAALRSEYGENWTENYPVPVKQLAEKDGLTYYLVYVSDVQYAPGDSETAAKYKKLFTAAWDITADDFSLDDLTDKDNTARRRQLLTSLGVYYAGVHMGAQHDEPYQVIANTDDNSCEIYVSRIDWTTEAQYKVYAADRVTFEDITNAEPTKVEHLADSTQGLTAEQFDLLYGKLDLPVYTDDELKNLQRVLQKDQIPEQGAAFFLGLGDMYGIFDGDSVQIYGENKEYAVLTYQFTDPNTGKENGKYVKLTMHKVTADSSLPALWIPYSYDLFTA